ncbi:unnamed protein product [Leptidea sinapis]|uniref:Uncharacterized protein n=1 Tax=Leptidea sinapis TaxID=189913 RepID=A0A5E4R5Q1_9NEOP|nr:unnamed protein product [Leptidea sinapis]
MRSSAIKGAELRNAAQDQRNRVTLLLDGYQHLNQCADNLDGDGASGVTIPGGVISLSSFESLSSGSTLSRRDGNGDFSPCRFSMSSKTSAKRIINTIVRCDQKLHYRYSWSAWMMQ